MVIKYCIADRHRPTIYEHFHQWLFLSEMHTSVFGAQPADVGSVAEVGGRRIAGGGRSLVWDATVAGG